MNCFDCASIGQEVPAVGVCAGCGAGICAEHAQLSPHWLTRTAVINMIVTVEPPARILRCPVCETAHEAARTGENRRAG